MGTLDQSTDSYDLDRWELLNAYLDGELTTIEEQQIEQWLQEDPTYRNLYQNLIALSEGCHHLPEPPPSASYGELCQGVFAEIEKQESHRWRWWGAAALVMGLVGAMGIFIPRSLTPQLAQQENTPPNNPQTTQVAISPQPLSQGVNGTNNLNISIHQSVIEIPKAPVAKPVKMGL